MLDFTLRLLSESLFYDAEYGISGNLSLVSPDALKEMYVGSFVVEEEQFVIEKAIDWEADALDEEVGYHMGIEFEELGTYAQPTEAARAMLQLAEEEGLLPSLTVIFDGEEG